MCKQKIIPDIPIFDLRRLQHFLFKIPIYCLPMTSIFFVTFWYPRGIGCMSSCMFSSQLYISAFEVIFEVVELIDTPYLLKIKDCCRKRREINFFFLKTAFGLLRFVGLYKTITYVPPFFLKIHT